MPQLVSNSDQSLKYDLIANAGDTFSRQVTLTNPDGSAANLTGFNFSFNIATLCGNISALQVVNAGSAPGITTSNNVIIIVIPSATMSTLTGNEFLYQFKMIGTDEAQTTTTLLRGKLLLLTQVGNG